MLTVYEASIAIINALLPVSIVIIAMIATTLPSYNTICRQQTHTQYVYTLVTYDEHSGTAPVLT